MNTANMNNMNKVHKFNKFNHLGPSVAEIDAAIAEYETLESEQVNSQMSTTNDDGPPQEYSIEQVKASGIASGIVNTDEDPEVQPQPTPTPMVTPSPSAAQQAKARLQAASSQSQPQLIAGTREYIFPGVCIHDIARDTGMTAGGVSRIFSGKRKARPHTLVSIANLYTGGNVDKVKAVIKSRVLERVKYEPGMTIEERQRLMGLVS